MRHILIIFWLLLVSESAARADIEADFKCMDCKEWRMLDAEVSACKSLFEIELADEENSIRPGWSEHVYSAEYVVSLEQPGHFGLLLAYDGEAWEMSAFIGRIEEDFGKNGVYGREYRKVHFEVPEERVLDFQRKLSKRELPVPSGDPNKKGLICLDGAILHIKVFSPDYLFSSNRHDCLGRTRLDEIADDLFDLAVEFDPKLESYRFTSPRKP